MAVRQLRLLASCCCECRLMTADACFIVVSCLGYLTGKMFDHTDEFVSKICPQSQWPPPILVVCGIFSSNYFQIGQHVVLLLIQI